MRNYTYKVTIPPSNTVLTLEEIKEYLRLDTDDTSEDALLLRLEATAVSFVEKYTSRTLLTTQFITYRDNFFGFGYAYAGYYYGSNNYCYDYWLLRKSPLQQVDLVQYYNTDNVLTTVDSDIYYNTFENDYSKILLNNGYQFPTDIIMKLQAIQILFTAGYGDTGEDVPQELKEAILMLIAGMYENRGDCNQSTCSSVANCSIMSLLDQYRIINI